MSLLRIKYEITTKNRLLGLITELGNYELINNLSQWTLNLIQECEVKFWTDFQTQMRKKNEWEENAILTSEVDENFDFKNKLGDKNDVPAHIKEIEDIVAKY